MKSTAPSEHALHDSPAVLLLIDVINHFEYPDGDRILRQALPLAPRLARLKKRARIAGISTIYVNDNFGQWRSDVRSLLSYCTRPAASGKVFVEQIRPEPDDYFVLKPMHSGFYQTPLEALLRYLRASTLILAGLTTNSCVVCTAHDARMRGFRLVIPNDGATARTTQEHRRAIEHRKVLVHPDRNGRMYVIDRATGEVLSAEAYAFQNTSQGVDLKTGRRKINPAKAPAATTVKDMCPAPPGGKDWQPSAFSPQTNLLYVPHNNLCCEAQDVDASYIAGTPYVGQNVRMYAGPGGHRGEFTAWDPVTARRVWQVNETGLAASISLSTRPGRREPSTFPPKNWLNSHSPAISSSAFTLPITAG